MAEKKNILTYEGQKKYEDELEELKVNKRVYSDFEINETIDLYMYEGFLNTTYYEYEEDN